MEMSNEQVVQRLISQETGIDSQRMRTGKLQENEWPLFTHAMKFFPIRISIWMIRQPSRRFNCGQMPPPALEFGLDLIIIDYLQLMSGDTRTDNRVQEVSYISRNLKVLARELNVPVLAAAQLSRAVEQRSDKKTCALRLARTGSLETGCRYRDVHLSP